MPAAARTARTRWRCASATPRRRRVGKGLEPDLAAQWLDLVAAWRALSAGEQEVLALAVFDDLSSPQAARVIGVTPAAYRLRLMRARRALRRHLDAADAPSATDPATQESTS